MMRVLYAPCMLYALTLWCVMCDFVCLCVTQNWLAVYADEEFCMIIGSAAVVSSVSTCWLNHSIENAEYS